MIKIMKRGGGGGKGFDWEVNIDNSPRDLLGNSQTRANIGFISYDTCFSPS